MINYRLYLLIIICLSYCICPSLSMAKMGNINSYKLGSKLEKIAQGVPDNSLTPSSAPIPVSAYDQAMQAGYKATQEKNYQTAQEQFQKALQARPNNIYAQQALQNVEFYLAKTSNPLSYLKDNGIVLWVGLLVIIMAIGISFWLFSRRFSSYSQDKFEEELLKSYKNSEREKPEEYHINTAKKIEDEIYIEAETKTKKSLLKKEVSSEKNSVKPKAKSEVLIGSSPENSPLNIQEPTRIPNQDVVEILLETLQEKDPKKRRKSIWELAQKADSRAMKPLVDLMITTDSQERSLILEALSQISARTLKPMNHALTISLQDKNPQVRKNAIRDLTRIYELMSQISQLLCHAIDDSDRDVQDTAKWAINQLNTQIPPRLELLTMDTSPEVTVEQSYSDTMD